MNILFLSQYFPPEIEVGGTRIFELAREFVERGHGVTVITGFPNYPTGKIADAYRGKFLVREKKEGIKIIRIWIYAAHGTNLLKRLLNQFSFMFTSFLGILFVNKVEVVIPTCPPLFHGLTGLLFSKIKRTSFVLEIRDIWPESAVLLGILNSRWMIKLGEWLGRFLYKRCGMLITVSEDMRTNLINQRVNPKKINIVRNGVDATLFRPKSSENWVRKQYCKNRKFLVLYTGTFGVQHNLEIGIEAAKLLTNHKEIKFLLVGDGREKGRLLFLKNKHQLANLEFVEIQPKRKIPDFINASDVCLCPLVGNKIRSLPAKIFEYMACEKPVILSCHEDAEARMILEEAQAGIWNKPENPEVLAKTIVNLINQPDIRKQMGINGRKYILKNVSRTILAEKYMQILQRVTENSKKKLS